MGQTLGKFWRFRHRLRTRRIALDLAIRLPSASSILSASLKLSTVGASSAPTKAFLKACRADMGVLYTQWAIGSSNGSVPIDAVAVWSSKCLEKLEVLLGSRLNSCAGSKCALKVGGVFLMRGSILYFFNNITQHLVFLPNSTTQNERDTPCFSASMGTQATGPPHKSTKPGA